MHRVDNKLISTYFNDGDGKLNSLNVEYEP